MWVPLMSKDLFIIEQQGVFFILITFLIIHLCICGHTYMQWSGDSFLKSVHSFHHMGPSESSLGGQALCKPLNPPRYLTS